MDSDRDRMTAQENDDNGDKGDSAEVAPGGVLAANLAAANMSSGTIGSLGGGPAGGAAVGQVLAENAQDDALNLDALEAFGSKNRETAGGVSSEQKEAEADELNG